MTKEVIITIAADGTSNIEANGFLGKGCKDATKQLEMVLAGGDAANKDQKPKPDFFATHTGMSTNTVR